MLLVVVAESLRDVVDPRLEVLLHGRRQLQQHLLELVAETTGAAVASAGQPLMEAGVDSIASVELR